MVCDYTLGLNECVRACRCTFICNAERENECGVVYNVQCYAVLGGVLCMCCMLYMGAGVGVACVFSFSFSFGFGC